MNGLRVRLLPALLASTLLLSACDTAESPPRLDARAPVVGAFAVSPGAAALDTLAATDDGALRLPVRLTLRAEAGDAPIARVAYAVQWQFACGGALVASGTLDAAGGDTYTVDAEALVRPGARGAYRVTAWAVDADGRLSNEVAGVVQLGGTNQGPPTIAQIEAPAEFRAPGTLRFRVTLSDPDGVADVARVEVETPGLGTFPLFDDGRSGDGTACDGTYGIAFSIPAVQESGVLPFVFRAYDRAGAASAPVPFDVTILR